MSKLDGKDTVAAIRHGNGPKIQPESQANVTSSAPSTRKTLENKIQSAFENKAEPEFIEKTIKSLIQAGILDFTESDKVDYKAA